MTEWEPATEAEAAMREALRGGDQEEYFRVLARTELLLPVSADSIAGQTPVGWGTWTTSGRTHVLAFTSGVALQACLAENAGSARRMAYPDLAAAWPNLEWWLAVNPGLPIEGYLPAWFVTQLARGDVRLPGRSMAARARLEKAESVARARATAVVPGRVAPPAAEPTSPAAGPVSQSPAGAGHGAGSLAGAAATGGFGAPAQGGFTAAAPGDLATPDRGGVGAQGGFTAAGPGGLATPDQGGFAAAGQGGLTTAATSGLRGAEQGGSSSEEPQGAPGPSALSSPRQSALAEGAGRLRDSGPSTATSGFGAAGGQSGAGVRGFGAAGEAGSSGFGAAGDARSSGFGAVGGQGAAEASDDGGVQPGAGRAGGPEHGDKDASGAERRGPLQGGLSGLTSAAIRASIRNNLTGADPAPPGAPTPLSGAGGPGPRPASAQGQPSGSPFGSAGGPPPSAISPLAAAPPPPVPGVASSGPSIASSGNLPRRVAGSGPAIPVGPIGANLPPISPEPIQAASAAPTSTPPATNGVDTAAAATRPWDTPPATQAWDATAGAAPTQPGEATATGGAPTQPWSQAAAPASERREPAPQAPPVQPPIDFKPANDVEKSLLASAADGSTDSFLSTLLLAKVLLPVSPVSADGTRPGEPGFAWLTETIDGEPYVVVFTSIERLQDHLGETIETIDVKFMQLIKAWPDQAWSFAVNPSTPVGAKLPGVQILALANWATEVGLGGDTEEIEPASRPAKKSATPDPNQPTIMQKVVARGQVDYYIERGYDRVSGFVHRANEVAHLDTPAKMYAALGLGYAGSPFKRDADEIFVLRWPAYRPSLYRIPYGGQNEPAMRAMEGWVIERGPFRGNGFAPSESGDVIAEFKVDSARLPHGAQLWRITSAGVETLVALLDSDAATWRKVGDR